MRSRMVAFSFLALCLVSAPARAERVTASWFTSPQYQEAVKHDRDVMFFGEFRGEIYQIFKSGSYARIADDGTLSMGYFPWYQGPEASERERITAVTLGPEGDLFLIRTNGNQGMLAYRWTTSGELRIVDPPAGHSISVSQEALVFDSAGRLWGSFDQVLDQGKGTATFRFGTYDGSVFTDTITQKYTIGEEGSRPGSYEVATADHFGNVYFARTFTPPIVFKVSSFGEISEIDLGSFYSIQGMKIDRFGNLFVSTQNPIPDQTRCYVSVSPQGAKDWSCPYYFFSVTAQSFPELAPEPFEGYLTADDSNVLARTTGSLRYSREDFFPLPVPREFTRVGMSTRINGFAVASNGRLWAHARRVPNRGGNILYGIIRANSLSAVQPLVFKGRTVRATGSRKTLPTIEFIRSKDRTGRGRPGDRQYQIFQVLLYADTSPTLTPSARFLRKERVEYRYSGNKKRITFRRPKTNTGEHIFACIDCALTLPFDEQRKRTIMVESAASSARRR